MNVLLVRVVVVQNVISMECKIWKLMVKKLPLNAHPAKVKDAPNAITLEYKN